MTVRLPRAATLLALLLVAALPVVTARTIAAPATGDPAPDFTASDLAGQPVRLHDYLGKVVLLNFWATWCAPCLEEIPRFSQWQQQYGAQGLQVLGVSMDDDAAPVRSVVQARHLAYPVVMGDARLARRFGGVLGLPLSLLLDRDGRIVARFQGEPALADVEARLNALLAAR